MEEQYVGRGRLAGAVTMLGRRGKVAYESCVGSMGIAEGKAMELDTIFRIASMTKPIASVALMALVEKGSVGLGYPVSRFIPSWGDAGVYVSGEHPDFLTEPVGRPMPVRDLLCHTSGLGHPLLPQTAVGRAYREIGFGHTVDDPRFNGTPRDMVEVISAQRFDAYLQDLIFEPLGMSDTGFVVPDNKISRLSAVYRGGADQALVVADHPDSLYSGGVTCLNAGGGLVSTAPDYARFCQMLLNGGELDGVRILGPRTVALMTTNHLPEAKGVDDMSEMPMSGWLPGWGFGLGFGVVIDVPQTQTPQSAGNHSWAGGLGTQFWVDPAEGLYSVCMTQHIPPQGEIFTRLKAIIHSAIIG